MPPERLLASVGVSVALELNDNIDPTALATFVLAIVTVVFVVIGGRALRQTRSEIDLSRREVEEAHRPVLIPVVDEEWTLRAGDVRQRGNQPLIERVGPGGSLRIPIRNIGSGPALDIEITIVPRTHDAALVELWRDSPFVGRVTGLGVGSLSPVQVLLPFPNNPAPASAPDYSVRVSYTDVAQKSWVTSANFLASETRYEELTIRAV